MQIKLFAVPLLGGEAIAEELNVFLRSKKVIQLESQLVAQGQTAFWAFCIRYIEGVPAQPDRKKVDYRQELDPESFARFANMRNTRKQIAQSEGIPAYAIFTDEELAALAVMEELTLSKMKSVKGIGEKKVEKYGAYFVGGAVS